MIQILISLFIVFTILFIMAFFLTYKRSWSLNLIIWGVFSVLIFSPIISFFLIIIPQYVTGNSWAGLIGMYAFPLLEVISLLMFIIGCIGYIIKKKTIEKSEDSVG